MRKRYRAKSWATRFVGSRQVLVLCFAASMFCATSSEADIVYGASATAKYEYNSNIFDLPADYTSAAFPISKRGDWYQAYGATFQANDFWGQQKAYLTASATDYRYGNYSYLDHVEYDINAGLNWVLSSLFDGKFDVTRVRTMVQFADLNQSELSVLTEEKETAMAGWNVRPDWRLQVTGLYHTVDEPLADVPDLRLTEGSGRFQIQYLGRAGLVAGISGTYMKGRYSGFPAEDGALYPDYDQYNYEAVSTYQFSGASSLLADAGYSRRTSASVLNNSSGPTGKIIYKNQLTPKTSVNFGVERDISSYITNGGSELDTSALGSVTWAATYKLTVSLGYTYTKRFLPDQGNLPGESRTDHLQLYNLKLDYNPLRWLWIEPYANVQDRSSNFTGGAYNSTMVGVQFDVVWHCPTVRCQYQR